MNYQYMILLGYILFYHESKTDTLKNILKLGFRK